MLIGLESIRLVQVQMTVCKGLFLEISIFKKVTRIICTHFVFCNIVFKYKINPILRISRSLVKFSLIDFGSLLQYLFIFYQSIFFNWIDQKGIATIPTCLYQCLHRNDSPKRIEKINGTWFAEKLERSISLFSSWSLIDKYTFSSLILYEIMKEMGKAEIELVKLTYLQYYMLIASWL